MNGSSSSRCCPQKPPRLTENKHSCIIVSFALCSWLLALVSALDSPLVALDSSVSTLRPRHSAQVIPESYDDPGEARQPREDRSHDGHQRTLDETARLAGTRETLRPGARAAPARAVRRRFQPRATAHARCRR